MCGIAGILYPLEVTAPDRQALHGVLETMAEAMAHRGPDGDGVWVSENTRTGLAHRRLAIIDLSPDAAQPMSNAEGTIWVTFNGEIYNHAGLRKELEADGHRFRTDHSDTEVLVHGYRAWGMDGLVERLEGMFAFAIWDTERRTLCLARDRIGIKPIYFTRMGGVFRFASEIKALLTDPSLPRRVDTGALGHYLSFMVAPAPVTLFKDIYKLPAAHIMEVSETGDVRARRYWDAVPGKGIAAGNLPQGTAEQDGIFAGGVLERLETAIEKRMMSDVPFGVFLSGGIDSSANVALMDRVSSQPVETFTVGFKDYDHLNEFAHARRIAEQFKTNHHEVFIGSKDMQDYLQDLIHQQDEPIADWVCVPLYFVSKLAKDSGVTVVQVGEGSDEQFCGYDSWMTYLATHRRFWDPYRRLVPAGLRRALGGLAGKLAPAARRKGAQMAEALLRAGNGQELFWSGANAFWNVHKSRVLRSAGQPNDALQDIRSMGLDLTGLESADSGDVVGGYFDSFDRLHPGQDFLTRMIYSEFRLRLSELLLMRVDKITMSTSVEGRVPFLDHALVDYSMDIPMASKVRGGVKKAVVKKALEGVIPDDIIHRPKMGFAAPVAQWLREDFGRSAEADVLSSALVGDGLLDRDYITGLFRSHRGGNADHALHLWTLFNLTAWHEHWIAN